MDQDAYLVWIVFGAVAGVGAVLFGFAMTSATKLAKKHARHVTSRMIGYASVSKDLMPIIWRLGGGRWQLGERIPFIGARIPFKGSHLVIFGSDGSYIGTPNGKSWGGTIEKWVGKGLKVEYLLLDVDEQASDQYLSMIRKLSDCSGSLKVSVVASKQDQRPNQAVLDHLETCHPTLMVGANGRRAAWIEGFHARGSEFAYDVQYIAPADLDRDGGDKDYLEQFDQYERLLDHVRDHSKPLSPVHAAA